jgi:hypothetical protein
MSSRAKLRDLILYQPVRFLGFARDDRVLFGYLKMFLNPPAMITAQLSNTSGMRGPGGAAR